MLTIRPAELTDLHDVADLLLADAQHRCEIQPGLWRLDAHARTKIIDALEAALTAGASPLRQQWLVAVDEGRLVGALHSVLAPPPPIYAGEFGSPGLIMEDSYVAPNSLSGTRRLLLEAAEADLIDAGAQIIVTSSVADGEWEADFLAGGYEPLTRYMAKTGLAGEPNTEHVRNAAEEDVPAIVALSAMHRKALADLHHPFWKPHDDADDRFGSWMTVSLNLDDRDMFVSDLDGVDGYAISQPSTHLHFPPPHETAGVGIIDDFFHVAFEDLERLDATADRAIALLAAAEEARHRRGNHSVVVVCPAKWQSKLDLLERCGYRNAITWHIKMAV